VKDKERDIDRGHTWRNRSISSSSAPGAHLLGPHAEEVINLFALAIRSGVAATDLKHLLNAYPTSGSDVPYMIP